MANKKRLYVGLTCSPEDVKKLKEAAKASRRTLSMFMLEASLSDADIVLTKKK